MMRSRMPFAGSVVLLSLLTRCLSGCSSTDSTGSSTTGTSGAPGAGGASAGSGGNLPAAAGSAGSGNASGAGGASTAGSGNGGASGAAQGGTGGAAGGGNAGAPANAILSADFEADLVGKQPAGWHNFLAYNIDAMNPQGDLQAIVDATKPHGGKNSLHVKSNGSPAFLTLPLPPSANQLYVRGYFYLTRQLGQNPGANHETLFGIRKDKDHEIRFGEIKGVIGVNEVPSDNISPKMDLWGKGPLIAANKWVCIEAAFIGDQPQHELHAWADGTEVLAVTAGEQWQNSVEPAAWLSGDWTEFMIGWQSFSNAANELWVDDLVLATSRISCQ